MNEYEKVYTKEEAHKALVREFEKGNTIPLGSKADYRKTALTLVQVAKEQTRELISTPEFVQTFCGSLLAGLRERDRTCMRLWTEIIGLVGAQQTLIVEIWGRLGVDSEESAKKYIQRSKGVEKMSAQDSVEKCLDLCVSYSAMHPDFKNRAIQRLGGVLPEAEVVE